MVITPQAEVAGELAGNLENGAVILFCIPGIFTFQEPCPSLERGRCPVPFHQGWPADLIYQYLSFCAELADCLKKGRFLCTFFFSPHVVGNGEPEIEKFQADACVRADPTRGRRRGREEAREGSGHGAHQTVPCVEGQAYRSRSPAGKA